MKVRSIMLAVVCLLFAVAPLTAGAAKLPNFVFVLVDDMGYADIGCMGAKDIKTPHIDRLAREGVRFTNFYANAPVCTPTRAAFITGRYQQRVGLEWALGPSAEQFRRVGEKLVPEPDRLAFGLPPGQMTIARLLSMLGYRCGAFGKWHLGFQPEHNPTKHGFHDYFGNLLGHSHFYRYTYVDGTYQLYENAKPAKAEGYLTDLINQRAVDFIDKNAKQPFFLYVPHLAVHYPFHVPDRPEQTLTKENYNEGTRKDYAAMLERVDKGVGMILDTLEKHKLADNTLVVFSSDNGGYYLSDNSPLFHHKSTLWEGGVRVPCLMRWPGKLPEGKVTNQAGITMDLTATFLAAAGGKAAEHKLDGIDLLPILTGKQAERERTFCWRIDRTDRKHKAVRQGKWKYIRDGMIELLFDLDADIGERRNLIYREPEIAARLRQAHAEWEADVGSTPQAFVVK